jgi:phosphatidylglycerol:prolipoprotein diacylglycerol transferase
MIEFPDINPIAFSLGPFDVRWYALSYLAGFLIGWQYVLYLSGLSKTEPSYKKDINKTDVDDFLPWGILGVIFGGRLGYILFYQTDMIWLNPLEIPAVWNGGMSFHGGFIGVMVSIFAFAKSRSLPLLKFSDLIACAAPIGLFFGRIANFVNGELFGRTTDVSWGFVFPRGGDLARHPSQLYEALLEGLLLTIILFVMVHFQKVRNKPGLLSGVFISGYALARFICEFFREPDLHIGFIYKDMTMGQILCIPMMLCGIGLIIFALNNTNLLSQNSKNEQA